MNYKNQKIGEVKLIICPNCDGEGTDENGSQCQECLGTGKLRAEVVKNG